MNGLQRDIPSGKELLKEFTQLDIVVDHQDRYAGPRGFGRVLGFRHRGYS